jgi:hypothetical protein
MNEAVIEQCDESVRLREINADLDFSLESRFGRKFAALRAFLFFIFLLGPTFFFIKCPNSFFFFFFFWSTSHKYVYFLFFF